MDWSEESAKALVVIGDCEPHPPSYTDQHINWRTELDVLKGMGVKVSPNSFTIGKACDYFVISLLQYMIYCCCGSNVYC